MHRIDTPTAQKDKFGAGKNGFTRGNPQTGTPATDLDDDYFDMLQEELAGVVEASGVNLEKSKHNQLLTALKALLLSRAHPFADIKADGAAAIAEALSNLGLGTAAKKDVGTGAGQIPDMSAWSLPSGGVGMPNGINFRYGYVSSTGDKTFSTPFPNQCFGIVFGQTYVENYWLFGPMFRENSLTKNGFAFMDEGWSGNAGDYSINATEKVFYIAIGN
ncbi:hypothetical protein [Escherichia coli]|uniref:hypothetical protein n=1 Tax=Escherichia coli TaxID=562 RepID=UPI00207BC266|nr:hypothetical protein [Escherichia coli]